MSLRAARERERERESNLSFASSLKKSFTLIELSIVLLILSLLVGSLLVGRQIVDRAKIQRIIFEFDYYEKAFHQFYDTYRVVPGNLDYKTCIKHAEFQGEVCDPNKTEMICAECFNHCHKNCRSEEIREDFSNIDVQKKEKIYFTCECVFLLL